ncbi:MAG: major capsid protein [Clostridiales bacterium]|nr:major capsid protein [Clostridiales bacterium]
MINIYEPQFMIEAIKQTPPMRTFFKDTFFRRIRTFPTKSVTFDVVKGGISMAPFVSPRIGSTAMERQGYKTLQYTPPLVAPKRVLTTDDLDIRLPGESIFNGYSASQRAAELLAADLIYLDEAITRREEWMIAQVLFTGKIPIKGEGVDDLIDFSLENIIQVDDDKLWSDHANSKPIDDLYDAAEMVSETGYTADVAIADVSTIRHLIRNEEVKDMLDRKNYNVGVVEPRQLANGVIYFGFLAEPGVYLYGYNDKYADNDNPNPDYPNVKPGDKGFKPAVYPLIPAGKVFVGSTRMGGEMLYGAINDLKIGNFMLPRVPKMWDNQEPSEKYIKISSRPLPCPHDTASWVIIDADEPEDEPDPTPDAAPDAAQA